jgi:hypothetical protein
MAHQALRGTMPVLAVTGLEGDCKRSTSAAFIQNASNAFTCIANLTVRRAAAFTRRFQPTTSFLLLLLWALAGDLSVKR